jgi:hypothetical protein
VKCILAQSGELERTPSFAIINTFHDTFGVEAASRLGISRDNQREANDPRSLRRMRQVSTRGQVAQVVERSPEKAGVGGSTPSLATIKIPA